MKLISIITAALITAVPAYSAAPEASSSLPAFDHVAINVADQQRSMDFYMGAFGLTEIAAPFPKGGPRWLALAGGISLHIQALAEKPAPPPRAVHFAIAVADLARVTGYLTKHGMTWTDAQGQIGKIQATRTDGVRQLYLQDPDGYWVEVNDKLTAN